MTKRAILAALMKSILHRATTQTGPQYPILKANWVYLEINADLCSCLYVHPSLANFYFHLSLKPLLVWEVTMGAIDESQVDAFSTNTGNDYRSLTLTLHAPCLTHHAARRLELAATWLCVCAMRLTTKRR
jgi:hypothetical protein